MSEKPSGALRKNHLLYAPGLKWRPRKGGDIPMWIAPAKDVRFGYRPKSLTLDPNGSPEEIASACRKQYRDLEDWRANGGKPKPTKKTIAWLIERYLTDPLSPFHKLKPDTQKSYCWECNRIRETIGERRLEPKMENGILVPRIIGEDIRRWHHNWGNPQPREEVQADGTVKLIPRKATPSRARHCLAMLRTLASYNVELGTPGAGQLREMLGAMLFDGANRRTKAPTYEQVDAIVSMALKKGYRSIAITTLAQYELMERRTHIIGQWDGESWGFGWVWDGNIDLGGESRKVGVTPDWGIVYYQTKKGANLREFDLKVVQRLLVLMQETPKEQRTGPIIICEDTGQPWEKRRYQETFREIARAAGVPDEIYSMDMRAGGASEAGVIESVSDRELRDGGGWADPAMPDRYRRTKQINAQKVVQSRQQHRKRGANKG